MKDPSYSTPYRVEILLIFGERGKGRFELTEDLQGDDTSAVYRLVCDLLKKREKTGLPSNNGILPHKMEIAFIVTGGKEED